MKEQRTYIQAIDLLRIVSILAVIFIHTTTRTLEITSLNLQRVPWALFFNQISRFAVPLFFMLSGFVLELNYTFHTSYLVFLKKRIIRIFIPYIFWSFIYYFFVYKQHAVSFLFALTDGSSSYQLYFIPTLLIFYIIFPLFHKYYHFISNKWVLLFLGLTQIFFLYCDYYLHSLTFFYPISIALLNYYVFILGIVASHYQQCLITIVKKGKFILIPIVLFLMGYIFFEGESRYLKTHDYLSFYSQWRPSVFLYTILLASLLYYFFNKIKNKLLVVKTLSKLSFFVFFVHVIVLETFWQLVGIHFYQSYPFLIGQFWYDPLFFIITASFSFFIAYLFHKIPLLAKITG